VSATIYWTAEAREDLIDIFVTIACDNEAAAERVCDEIESRVMFLMAHPRLGVRRPEIATSARMLVIGV
jgi:toxin ParE1/3/4